MRVIGRAAPARRPRDRGEASARSRGGSPPRWRAGEASSASRPISTRSRARCDSSAWVAPNARASSASRGTSPGHASPSARASANSTGRVASETTVPASRTAWRHASTTSASDASRSLDLGEPKRALLAAGNQACGGRVQDLERAVDLGHQRRNACAARRIGGPFEGSQRGPRPQASQRRCPRPRARGRRGTRQGTVSDRAQPAPARPRPRAR